MPDGLLVFLMVYVFVHDSSELEVALKSIKN